MALLRGVQPKDRCAASIFPSPLSWVTVIW